MLPFELLLKGENTTLLHHLAYGKLEETYPVHFAIGAAAAALQDHHWRLMSTWQAQAYADRLPSLDGRVSLALSCLKPVLPKLVRVSNFTSPAQADRAFMATGTAVEAYDGPECRKCVCSDGGATSGKNMTPLFQDGARPQLIVDLMQTGFPSGDALKETVATEVARATVMR